MNCRREAIEKLKDYTAKRNSIQSSIEEIKRLDAEIAHIRSAISDTTPVSRGDSAREDMLINSIAKKDELKLALSMAKWWVKKVDRGLMVLDEQERRILDLFFIHRAKGNVGILCEELGIEQSSIYRRRDSALRRFTLALYGVVET